MSPWNYRIMRHKDRLPIHLGGTTEYTYSFHEVYYEYGKNAGWSENPIAPLAETINGLRNELDLFKKAFKRPILDYKTGKEIDDSTA